MSSYSIVEVTPKKFLIVRKGHSNYHHTHATTSTRVHAESLVSQLNSAARLTEPRFYIGSFGETNGEREYNHPVLIACYHKDTDPAALLDTFAKNWYGSEHKEDNGAYRFSDGACTFSNNDCSPIAVEVYDALTTGHSKCYVSRITDLPARTAL